LKIQDNRLSEINLSGLSYLSYLNLAHNDLFEVPKLCDNENESLLPLLKMLNKTLKYVFGILSSKPLTSFTSKSDSCDISNVVKSGKCLNESYSIVFIKTFDKVRLLIFLVLFQTVYVKVLRQCVQESI
jgi:hypothetical protein